MSDDMREVRVPVLPSSEAADRAADEAAKEGLSRPYGSRSASAGRS